MKKGSLAPVQSFLQQQIHTKTSLQIYETKGRICLLLEFLKNILLN